MADFSVDVVVETDGVSVTPPDTSPTVTLGELTIGVVTVAGERGPQGPSGASGFIHTQSTPAATWTITHNLGRVPLSCEVSISDEVVYTDVSYPDSTTAVLTFASPQTGTARFS